MTRQDGRGDMGKISASLREGVTDLARGARAFPGSFRRAIRDPRSMTAGANPVPIVVLFSHTFLDAFDRGGFNIILPEVQDHFDLDLQAISSLAAVATVAGIALSLPVSLGLGSERSAHHLPRPRRVRGRRVQPARRGGVDDRALRALARRLRLRAHRQRPGAAEPPVRLHPGRRPDRRCSAGRQIADNLGNLLARSCSGCSRSPSGSRAALPRRGHGGRRWPRCRSG